MPLPSTGSSSSSSSLSRCPSTCRRRRSGKCAIGVQSLWNHPSVFVRPQGCEPWDVYLTQREGEGRLDLLLGSGINTHKEYYLCPPSFLRWQRVGRKEGRERKRERWRGNELFEAERVVKLWLVQTETGETRQLWKSGRRALQVSVQSSVSQIIDVGTNVGSVKCLFFRHCWCFALPLVVYQASVRFGHFQFVPGTRWRILMVLLSKNNNQFCKCIYSLCLFKIAFLSSECWDILFHSWFLDSLLIYRTDVPFSNFLSDRLGIFKVIVFSFPFLLRLCMESVRILFCECWPFFCFH